MQSKPAKTATPTVSPAAFGYLVVGRPMEAKFQSLGQHFNISYLPYHLSENAEQTLMGRHICLWLAKDVGDIEVVAYIIWPGTGILSLGEGLNANHPSRLVELGRDSGTFQSDGSSANIIMQELLNLATRPCILFVRSPPMQEDFLEEEARRLSFCAKAVNWTSELEAFLDAAALSGDAVKSSQIHHWYQKTITTLQTADQTAFLFDPTRFLAGMLKHLHHTLLNVNRLDVNQKSRTGGPVLIPMCFVRSWKEEVISMVQKDFTVIQHMMTNK
ncbi:hypothetical protein CPB83DRAFT_899980 [Crepidotus variabilis]|uniref:Uncharacterized protein n=1 Tax=Crepidotus variabilis TaxID=179855 RepID=A0A9P6E3T6_9AGAR|nr:hypothetical protein CPB83DRAFT_899980 [Crepidotus variabilis]